MKLELDYGSSAYVIQSYSAGLLVINHQRVTGSCIVLPDQLIDDWRPQSFDDLTSHDLAAVAKLSPEIVLLGTGKRLMFPSTETLAPLVNQNIAIEVMDTAAACRSYTVLMAEGRRVAAALLMIKS